MTEKSCKTCAYCRENIKRKGKTERIIVYSCNEAGMMATEDLLPKHCERWREEPATSMYIGQNKGPIVHIEFGPDAKTVFVNRGKPVKREG